MKTRLKLLVILVTCTIILASVWYGLDRLFVRHDYNSSERQKSQAGLLRGVWRCVEQHNPPLPEGHTATIEFTDHHVVILRVTGPNRSIPQMNGMYRVDVDKIHIEWRDTDQVWDAKITEISNNRLVMIGSGREPITLICDRD